MSSALLATHIRLAVASLAYLVAVVLAAPTIAAQTATTRPSTAAAPAERPPTATPQGYSYNPEGRRDPFLSLLSRGSDQRATSPRPEGLAGVSVADVAIRGIVASQKSYVAMIEAPDGKTYIVRGGDKLFDATVKAVLADAVVFVQQVTDPLSLVKQREIRKPLRAAEEGK